MLRGLYTAAAGMLAQTIATDTTANNLANVTTAGFKRNGVSFQGFPEMLLRRILPNDNTPVGGLLTGARVASTAADFIQGSIHRTGNPLDVALQGPGFFAIQQKGATTPLYTRDGSFTLNAEGYLSTSAGHLVLGKNGPIQIPPGQVVAIAADGTVTANGTPLDTLEVVQFAKPQALTRLGDNVFQATPGAGPATQAVKGDTGVLLYQGSLETSNVNAVREMVNSITGLRVYESLEKVIRMQNDTLQLATREVGNVR
jgi:flagellar basal-body rod protein FlgG